MDTKQQPTRTTLIENLEKVQKGIMQREVFNQWAYKWVQNFESRAHLALTEEDILEYLLFLLAIDLEIEPGVYFHGDEELAEWIGKIKEGQPLS